ncbi:MAG: putative NADPH-dependent reductase [Bradyrhizobium sp.]|jgi:chromate reductase|nr:putative NADPH-dependent reductase [Bradyrhizobium sp.]
MIDQHSGRVRLLGLSGSLRRASYSTAILRELQVEIGDRADLELADLRLPLYNQDDDTFDGPKTVLALREAIATADGLVISTPEYNHGIPGVLKNALDWASRPSGKSALQGKKTLIISNSPAFTGGVRAHAQLNETMLSVHAFILPGRQVVIGSVAEKIRDGGFVDSSNLSFALAAVHRMIDLHQRAHATHCA